MSGLGGCELGQYRIVDEIGRGGMATVYRAEQPSIGREVAIKVLHRGLIEQDAGFLERFFREVQVAASLQHPYILPVYDYGESDGQPYIVMAYLTGGTLADYITQQGQMRLPEAARLVGQIASALDYAHSRGIIHRDFKPSNVLMDEPGNAYLADFGLAKVMQDARLSASGVAGTPDYMAPDWAQEGGVTPAVDMYALGVTLYQMLTGEVPYRASSPMGVLLAHLNEPIPDVRAIRTDLPEALQEVINRALAKSPENRFATPADLASALEDIASGRQATLYATPLTAGGGESLCHPAAWGRDVILGARAVLGEEHHNAILLAYGLGNYIDNPPPDDMQVPFPHEHCGRLWQGIYEVYGSRGLKAVAKQVVACTLEQSMAREANIVRVLHPLVRKIGSFESKLRLLYRYWIQELNQRGNMGATSEETEEYWILRLHQCSACRGWHAPEPVCHVWSAYMQAAAAWYTGGAVVHVVETECRAMGHEACTFVVDKRQLDR
jgi:predicted hydrocarbon binding protein